MRLPPSCPPLGRFEDSDALQKLQRVFRLRGGAMRDLDRVIRHRDFRFIVLAVVLFGALVAIGLHSTDAQPTAQPVAQARPKIVHRAPDTREVLGVYPRPQGCDRPDMRFTTAAAVKWLCRNGTAYEAAW